ncbi:hypothetical protein Tco_0854177 [Tanacetum coccineum]
MNANQEPNYQRVSIILKGQPLLENHKDTNGGGGESIQALTKHLTPRIREANPLLILIILKTFECLRLHTLHTKPWENEFESFSGLRLSEYIRQLILCPHEIQLNHSFFHLFSDEMMSDVDVFRPGVLNVVAAKSYGTLVVTVQRDAIVSKAII